MSTGDFWPTAWDCRERLYSPPEDDTATAVVDAIKTDRNLQWYVFSHPEQIDGTWLIPFADHGLFQSPPQVERDGTSVSASGWPALRFLKARVSDDSDLAANILGSIETDNWWVIADSLDIATLLPIESAQPILLRFLGLWYAAPAGWLRSDLLPDVLKRLMEGPSSFGFLQEGVFLVAASVLKSSELEYEYEERISGVLIDTPLNLRSAVLDGIEAALAFADVDVEPPWLSTYRFRTSQAASLLLATWSELVEREPAEATIVRAARLYDSSSASRRAMGVRTLGVSLAGERSAAASLQMFNRLAADLGSDVEDASFRSSLVDIVATYTDQIDDEVVRGLVAYAREGSSSQAILDRYHARDVLHALRSALGPEELRNLESLEKELGPVEAHGGWREGIASFVQPESAVPVEDLLGMTSDELRGVIRNPPVGDGRSFFEGASLEGFGTALRTCVQERFGELLPDLPTLAASVRDTTVGHSLVWGAREAIRAGAAPDGAQLELVAFIEAMREVVEGWSVQGQVSEPAGYGVQTVTRGLADLVEASETWLFARRDLVATRLLESLAWLMASPDPSSSYEEQYGGDNMDPPTLALNSTRGSALLTALKMLSHYWGEDPAAEDELAEGLKELVRDRCVEEPSPAVRSGLGMYLSQLVVYWPTLMDDHEADVLPLSPDLSARWEAVFATHLRFQHPFRRAATQLKPHFALAVDRLEDDTCKYLLASAERLITHLMALSMPRADDAAEWREILVTALARSPDEVVGNALNELSHAVRLEALDVPPDWFSELAAQRTDALRAVGGRNDEATALMRLLMNVGMSVAETSGLLISLMELGAKPRGAELVEYLSTGAEQAPQSTASVLNSAIDRGLFDRAAFYVDDGLTELLRTLASGAPRATWTLVNRLGAAGMFSVEPIAKDVSTQVDVSAAIEE